MRSLLLALVLLLSFSNLHAQPATPPNYVPEDDFFFDWAVDDIENAPDDDDVLLRDRKARILNSEGAPSAVKPSYQLDLPNLERKTTLPSSNTLSGSLNWLHSPVALDYNNKVLASGVNLFNAGVAMTEPGLFQAMASSADHGPDIAQLILHADREFRERVDPSTLDGAQMLETYDACLKENRQGAGSKSLLESISLCLGLDTKEGTPIAGLNASAGTAARAAQHPDKVAATAAGTGCSEYFGTVLQANELSVVDQLFCQVMQTTGISDEQKINLEEARKSWLRIFGDYRLVIDNSQIANGYRELTRKRIKPLATTEEVYMELSIRAFKDFLNVMYAMCYDYQGFIGPPAPGADPNKVEGYHGALYSTFWANQGKDNPGYEGVEKSLVRLNVGNLDFGELKAIKYFKMFKDWGKGFNTQCDVLEPGSIDVLTLDDTNTYIHIFKIYWDYAEYVAAAHLAEISIRAMKLVSKLPGIGPNGDRIKRVAMDMIYEVAETTDLKALRSSIGDNLAKFDDVVGDGIRDYKELDGSREVTSEN